ncbi:hypothetical protein KUL156_11060 [Alteromonas sp. KUL156]|nr:hypothetical protein KUL154_43220 [Alteromonas sp. KUL154]GFD98513.1 hypothetical protein KUL156_11060 [Alteromonas sp. KUL156]
MFRKILLSLGMLAISAATNASVIVINDSVTGADMAGIEVTVTFDNNTSESSIWSVIADNGGVTTVDAEGRIGGAIASTWSLSQQGYTLGGVDQGIFYGLWTFENNSMLSVTKISISGIIAGLTSIVFDSIPIDSASPTELTPGSGGGQGFVTQFLGAVGTYADQVNPLYDDLFYTLNIDFSTPLQQGETMVFFADTDQVASSVPAPGTLAILLSCGMLLVLRRFSRTLSN